MLLHAFASIHLFSLAKNSLASARHLKTGSSFGNSPWSPTGLCRSCQELPGSYHPSQSETQNPCLWNDNTQVWAQLRQMWPWSTGYFCAESRSFSFSFCICFKDITPGIPIPSDTLQCFSKLTLGPLWILSFVPVLLLQRAFTGQIPAAVTACLSVQLDCA